MKDARCKTVLHSPLKGKYLIQNSLANWIFRWMDASFSLLRLGGEKNFVICSPKKVLLSNIAHLGDVILMTSLLSAIKKAIPDVQIGVIVGSWAREMVEGHPLIDFVHLLDHWKVVRSSSSLLRKVCKTIEMAAIVRNELKQIQYDIAVECNFHFPNTIFLTYRAKIPVRIGYTSGGFGPLLTHPVSWTDQNKSVAAYALFLISQFANVEEISLKPILPIRKITVDLLPKEYVVIHIGSGNPIKEWPLENWKKLCRQLVRDGYFLVFTGKGEREAGMIEKIAKQCPNVLDLCDQLSWGECIPLVRAAQALISVDTGMGHIAAAVETPSVLIYSGIHQNEQWRPLTSKATILMHPTPCYPCHRNRGCESMRCVKNIHVDIVYAAFREALRVDSIKPKSQSATIIDF